MSRRVALAAAASFAAVLCAACGGSSGRSEEPPADRSVSLLANTHITPWVTGTVGFRITPALAAGESMRCQIDNDPEVDCATGPSTGRIAYENLSSGTHVLTVKSGSSGAMTASSASWEITMPDVVVFGGTPGGISAALAVARAGRRVVLVEPSPRLGGMMTGGLAKSDVGGSEVKPLGGITREFFDRVREREIARGACSDAHPCPGYYDFEPHVAGEVFAALLAEEPLVSIQRSMQLLSVKKEGHRITAVLTERGELTAEVFVDASYEGDLMVQSGVSHTSLREARLQAADGVDQGDIEDDAGFGNLARPYGLTIDPYVIPGQPSSGLISFVESPPPAMPAQGSADGRLMAYNYRLCVTDDPTNQVPFSRPADYDPIRYEGSARLAVAMASTGKKAPDELFFNPASTVHSKDPAYFKHDLNGGAAFSTDMTAIGWNQDYPTASPSGREAIAGEYRRYIEGLLYFWQTDPRFGSLNAKVARFGYCADEFADNGHWPYHLYTRETRRMVGEYVMNENDVLRNGRRPVVPDSIGMGAYGMDSHIRRFTTTRINGKDVVVTEGFRIVHQPNHAPYPIAYRSLLPRREQASNLLNPVTLSATSMAYSSLRMEPTFMVLGQAAGTAAAMAVDSGGAVHDLDIGSLQARLQQDGQILH